MTNWLVSISRACVLGVLRSVKSIVNVVQAAVVYYTIVLYKLKIIYRLNLRKIKTLNTDRNFYECKYLKADTAFAHSNIRGTTLLYVMT
jgi:hypothetical protein